MTASTTGVISKDAPQISESAGKPPGIPIPDDDRPPRSRPSWLRRSPLPGFGLGITITMGYLSVLLIIPLIACILKASTLSWNEFIAAIGSERALYAYWVTFKTSLLAAVFNTVAGLLLAWVLVRYQFYGRHFLDALIDLPFALPTAVAGLVFSALLIQKGWYGQFLVPLGIYGDKPQLGLAYTQMAIVIVIIFVGLPFVVRTIQPVLESLDKDIEEAAASLGASRLQTFTKVLFPALWPAMLTGFALSFARGLGEYGAVVFVSGNKPFNTEISPVLIVARLEQFAYAEATAIALVLVTGSLICLAAINWLERRSQRYAG